MTEAVSDLPVLFAAAMARIGPFEPGPHLAVAVSGGADSMALLLLASAWAQARGGLVSALSVDHGLRAASATETRLVASWCQERGIAHATLVWEGAKPDRGIQARARVARYALLEQWCRDAGVLHLLLGHHRDDQAETMAMRAAMKSGPAGLAGMAAISERRDVRLLRPLLRLGKQDLMGWLLGQGQPWLEDPSNRDPRFQRTRLRIGKVSRPPEAPSTARGDADRALAQILARIAAIHPEGWVRLELGGLRALAPGGVADVLRRTVLAVAGALYPPRGSGLSDCATWVAGSATPAVRTLAGFRLVLGAQYLDVVRECAALPSAAVRFAAGELIWDRRFRVRSSPLAHDELSCAVAAGLSRARHARVAVARRAAVALPAHRGVDGTVTLPHVFYGRGLPTLVSVPTFDVTFRPHLALGGAAFAGPQAVSLSSMLSMHADATASQPHRPSKSLEPQ